MFIRRKPLGSRNFRRPGSLGLNLLRGSMSRIQALTIRRMPLFTAPEAVPLTLDEPAERESVVRPDAQPADMEQPEAFDFETEFEAEEAEFVEESPEEYTPPPQLSRAAARAAQPSPSSPVQRKAATPSQTVKPTSGPPKVARSTVPSTPATKAPDKGASRPATRDRFPAVPRGEIASDLKAIFNLHKSRGFADHLPQPENVPETPKIDPEAIAREVQRTSAESPDASVETPSSEPVRVRGRRRSKVMEIIPESTRAAMEAEDARKAKIASQYLGDQAPAHPSVSPASATPVQRSPAPPEFEPTSQVPEIVESAEANDIANNEPAESVVETPLHPIPQAVQRETAAYEPMEDAEVEETDVVDESPAEPAPSASHPAVPSVARPPVQRSPADYSDQADEPTIELDADSDDIPMPPPAERPSSRPAVQRNTAQPTSIQRAPEPDLTSADDESLNYSDDTDRSLPEQSVDVYEALLSAGMAYEQPSTPSGEPESIPTTIMPPIGRPGQRNKHFSSAPPSTVAAKREDSAPQLNPPAPTDYMQNMQTMIDFPTAQRSLEQPSDAENYASSDESEAPASDDDDSSYQMPSRPRAAPAEAVHRTFAESGGEPEEVDLEVAEPSILDQGDLDEPSTEAGPASRSVQRKPAVDTYDQEPGDSYPEISPEANEPHPTRATRSVQRTPAPRDDMPEVLDLPDSGLQMDTDYAESAPQDIPEIEPPARTDSVKPARRSVQRMPAPDVDSNETYHDSYTEDAPAAEPTARPSLRHASRGGVQRTPAPEPEEETFEYAEEMGEDGAAIDMPSMPDTANTSARSVQRSPASDISPEQGESLEQGETDSEWLTQDVQADLLSLLNLPTDAPVQHNPPSNKPATSKSVQRQPAEAPKAVQRAAEQNLAQDMVQRELTSTDTSSVGTGSVTSSGSQAPDSQGSAQADPAAVEQMAQQVYRLLRQRLRIERERQNK